VSSSKPRILPGLRQLIPICLSSTVPYRDTLEQLRFPLPIEMPASTPVKTSEALLGRLKPKQPGSVQDCENPKLTLQEQDKRTNVMLLFTSGLQFLYKSSVVCPQRLFVSKDIIFICQMPIKQALLMQDTLADTASPCISLHSSISHCWS